MDFLPNGLETPFSPQSVAVIGASDRFRKWGFGVFSRLLKGGGPYRIYPVNRKASEVLGIKAYPRVSDIPDEVELAVLVIPPPIVPEAMNDCVRKGVKTALVITAGFRETGPEGAALQPRWFELQNRAGSGLWAPIAMVTSIRPLSCLQQAGWTLNPDRSV